MGVIPGSRATLRLGNQLFQVSTRSTSWDLAIDGEPQWSTDVGLDVSLKLTAICIVDRTGKIEREGAVASAPRQSLHLSSRMRRMSPKSDLRQEQRRPGNDRVE